MRTEDHTEAPARNALRAVPPPRGPLVGAITRRVILRALGMIRDGGVVVVLPDGRVERFGDASGSEWRTLTVVRDDLFRRLGLRGRIGFGEAYVAGDWETDDLAGLLGQLGRNIEIARARQPMRTLVHTSRIRARLPRLPTRERAERHIHYHYDIGNDLYRLFLDESLTYSCAVFEHPGQSLADAQQAKYRRIADAVELEPDDHVLEIGCGWGSFAIHAARERGCRVTGVTISREQHDLARARVADAGLSDRVEIVYRDYRELEGSFSKIVSIEMFEAIGESQFDTYFRTLDRLLAPGGRACVQSIAIPDHRYATYRRTRDFIQTYVFPGSHIPSLQAMTAAIARSSGFAIVAVDEIGGHYAETLRQWRETFLARQDEVRALGYGDRFVRTWEFYLAFCEAGFRERLLHDVQVVLAR